MTGFLRDNWFFLILLAMCFLGHFFGHGGCGMHGQHERKEKPAGEKKSQVSHAA